MDDGEKDEFLDLVAARCPYATVTTVEKREGKPCFAIRTPTLFEQRAVAHYVILRSLITSRRDVISNAIQGALSYNVTTATVECFLYIFFRTQKHSFRFVLFAAVEEITRDAARTSSIDRDVLGMSSF